MQTDNVNQVTNTINDRVLAFAFTQGKFWVYNGKDHCEKLTWENLRDRAWVVVSYVSNTKQNMVVKHNRHKLIDGDIIRFGKVVFKVSTRCRKDRYYSKKPAKDRLPRICNISNTHHFRKAINSDKAILKEFEYLSKESNKFNSDIRKCSCAPKLDCESVSEDSVTQRAGVVRRGPAPKQPKEPAENPSEKVCRI